MQCQETAMAVEPIEEPRPARILLVDDRPTNLVVLQALLEGAGHEILTASSGKEAVALTTAGDFALILLDVMMPEMDGFETARRIRDEGRNGRTPIIFITAYKELEEQLLRAYVVGGVDFLYKPIDPEVLKFKVSVFVDLYRQRALVKRYSTQLEAANTDLERRVAERTAELHAANDELRLLAHASSHDLKEPLRTIANYTRLLDERYKQQLGGDAKEFINFITDGAHRLDSLLNDLLAYSEQLNPPRYAAACCDSEAVLGEVVMMLDVLVRESHAVITHDPLPQVGAEFNEVTKLFQNLIGNAIKFRGADAPHIRISAQQQNEKWLFSVKDNGIGIHPQHHGEIFGIFKRLHGREYDGNGIGLAICKKIVERRDGRIWVDSQPGQGSTFYFTLPEAV
ncbi:MAG: hybrid sensor histidine kinase/response regulator [Acidobacteria bacterium]|jgi:signal transduction histidine kinase|nr:MAG: hybrid sensor histidine kinase/response regulator [Acidobacteriota bacterium]